MADLANNTSANTQSNQNVLTGMDNLPIQDGQVPQQVDQTPQQGTQVDALGTENFDIQFQSGNYEQTKGLPEAVKAKTEGLTKTFVPLVEVALIELTGSSQMYLRKLAQITPSFDENSSLKLSFTLQYVIPGYIGTEFEYADLQSDSKYIYDRLLPSGAKITKCEIDTNDGSVTIMGEL